MKTEATTFNDSILRSRPQHKLKPKQLRKLIAFHRSQTERANFDQNCADILESDYRIPMIEFDQQAQHAPKFILPKNDIWKGLPVRNREIN